MTPHETFSTITAEIAACLNRVDASEVEQALDDIANAPRVFIAGAGRTALAMRGFAMRLMHLGIQVHVVGEITTPAIAAGDWLVVGSGSGRTESLVAMAQKARGKGARILLFTINTASPLGEVADHVVQIPAPSPKLAAASGLTSIQPMGTLFEQSLHVLLDACVIQLMARRGADSDAMFTRHANLE